MKIVDTDLRETPSQFADADKVLADIDEGAVFDDIQVEFDQVLLKSVSLAADNSDQVLRDKAYLSLD